MFCYIKGHSYKWLFILESILDLTLVQIVLISTRLRLGTLKLQALDSMSHLEIHAGFLSIVYEGKM
jgi:hypothetical protein